MSHSGRNRNTAAVAPVAYNGRFVTVNMDHREGVKRMSESSQNTHGVHEGTRALQEIAVEVERERGRSGHSEFDDAGQSEDPAERGVDSVLRPVPNRDQQPH